MSTRISVALSLLALASSTAAHMSIWTPAMYGVGWNGWGAAPYTQGGGYWTYDAGDPVAPLGPNWSNQDDWWFRGPEFRALPPPAGAIETLPAGGSWTVQIACHVAWTSYGVSTTTPGSLLDACPGNPGAHHSGDPAATDIDRSLLSGCALGIANVDDISKVTMDNLAIFSVKHACVDHKYTTFNVPAKMPACTGKKCICAWFWLANNGTANFYMTAFDCNISNVSPTALPIAPPKDPVWCAPGDTACMNARPGGSKRPLYAYNSPSNIVWDGNYDRPGYHANWGFPNDGAQNDIFVTAQVTTTSAAPTTNTTTKTTATTTVAAVTTTTAAAVTTTQATTTQATTTQAATTQAATTTTTTTTTKATTTTTTSAAPVATPPVTQATNLALTAVASGSSSYAGATPNKINDGSLSWATRYGWISRLGPLSSWVRLEWSSAQTFNQIVLYDRPNLADQITSGVLIFDGNLVLSVGALNNDGSATYVNLTSVKSTTVTFLITGESASTTTLGLTEMQVYNRDASTLRKTVSPRKRDLVYDLATDAPPAQPVVTRHPRDFKSASIERRAPDNLVVEEDPLAKRCVGLDHSCDLTAEKLFS